MFHDIPGRVLAPEAARVAAGIATCRSRLEVDGSRIPSNLRRATRLSRAKQMTDSSIHKSVNARIL